MADVYTLPPFDVEYIYVVRQVDDVTAQPFQRTVTPARATP